MKPKFFPILVVILITSPVWGFSLNINFQGAGGTRNMSPGASMTINNGTVTNMGTDMYSVSLPCSGGFTLNNLTVVFNVDGYIYTLNGCGASINMPAGINVTFTINYTVPDNVGCNSTCNYILRFTNQMSGIITSNNETVKVVNPGFSGNTDVCYPTSSTTYTLTFYGNISNPGSRTWSINGTGWLINGSNPCTTTASSVSITMPSQANNATLTISGTSANLCSTINIPLHYNTTYPSTPTVLNKSRLGSTCYYYLTTSSISTATSYQWSCNSNFSDPVNTSTNTTQTVGVNCPDLLENTTVPIYVRARNGCNYSGVLYRNTFFPHIANCMLKSVSDSTFLEQYLLDNSEQDESFDLCTLGHGLFQLMVNSEHNDLEIQVYSINGQLIKSIRTDQTKIQINLESQPDGIYFMKISNSEISKVIKLQKTL